MRPTLATIALATFVSIALLTGSTAAAGGPIATAPPTDGTGGESSPASPLAEATAPTDAETEAFHRYGFESGIIRYMITGKQSGTRTLYFDGWGRREARYDTLTVGMMGTTHTGHTLDLRDGASTWIMDLDTKRTTKGEDAAIRALLDEGTAGRDVAAEILTSRDGWKRGTEELDGRACELWELSGRNTRIWVWKGLALRTVVRESGVETVTEATRIEEDAAVPAERLRLPGGARIVDPTRGVELHFPSLEQKTP